MPRTVTVSWDDFEAAFIIGSPDARYFVNVVTGEVQYTSHLDDDQVRGRIVGRTKGEDWVEIPRASSSDGMAEIRAFIDAEPDAAARAALQKSLGERVPFRAFMMALAQVPEGRRRWADARLAGIHARLARFCRERDLEIDDERYRAIVRASRD